MIKLEIRKTIDDFAKKVDGISIGFSHLFKGTKAPETVDTPLSRTIIAY